MKLIALCDIKQGKVLSELSAIEQDHVMNYLLNYDFVKLSAAANPRYRSPVTGRNMNEDLFVASDGKYTWVENDFYSIRDEKQTIPDDFVQHVCEFFMSGATARIRDEWRKCGLRKRYADFPQTEEGMRAFQEAVDDWDDFQTNKERNEYCLYPKTSSDFDDSITD